MVYYELVVTLQLQNDLEVQVSYEYLSRLISRAMLEDDALKKLHEQKTIKGYTYCGLYPVEEDRLYKKNRVYLFHIRSFDMDLILLLKSVLGQIAMGVLATEIRTFEYRILSQLMSLTPIVATVNNQSWTQKDGIKLLMERAHVNALKKHRAFLGDLDEPEENFISSIRLVNEKPIKIPYKRNSFLGHKVVLQIKEDAVSQKLAFAVLGAGLLEKNSVGMGYCMYE